MTVDELYQKLVNLLTEQMDKHIPYRVRPTDKHISHKPHSAKPWWTPEVSQSWEQVRQAEQSYLRAQGGQRRILRARYIKRHRLFSKQLQREKRIHWRKTQDELLQSVHDSQHTFWQKINTIDKGQHRTVPIPMEVKLEDGSISCDRDILMGRWETTFSNLLNPSPPDGDLISPKVAEVTDYLTWTVEWIRQIVLLS